MGWLGPITTIDVKRRRAGNPLFREKPVVVNGRSFSGIRVACEECGFSTKKLYRLMRDGQARYVE